MGPEAERRMRFDLQGTGRHSRAFHGLAPLRNPLDRGAVMDIVVFMIELAQTYKPALQVYVFTFQSHSYSIAQHS